MSSRKAANGSAKSTGQLQNGSSKQAKVDENRAVQGKAAAYNPAPRTTSYEFLGPPGALLISTLCPFFAYFFAMGCDKRGCPPLPFTLFIQNGWKQAQTAEFWSSLLDMQGVNAYLAWYAFCVVCWAVLPGKWLEGGVMRNGEKLWYKINGFGTLVAALVLAGSTLFVYGREPFLFVTDHWIGLSTGALLMAIFQALYCYAVSFIPGAMLAEGGNTGNALYDWFIGRQLNPRIGIFDIKTFNELRPGLVLWLLLDLSLAVRQYDKLGRITDSMLLVILFQGVYVFDAMWCEAGILSQMDITTDGFGFMLSVGDLSWVPFTYCLQARYLAYHPVDLGYLATAAVLAVNLTGYYIFRVSNDEKNDFRHGKNPKNLKFMKTERGTNLLTSGWWGRSRHPNYMGDLIMALAWCLPTGFNTPLTYFYVIYFAILLVHRQLRDDEACHKKYGKDWKRYCEIVRWKIIPGLY